MAAGVQPDGDSRSSRNADRPGARIGEAIGRHAGEAEGIIEFAMKEQTTVGTDGRAAEHERHRPVECEP